MNQILFVDNKKNRSSIDIKKIIKFFAMVKFFRIVVI